MPHTPVYIQNYDCLTPAGQGVDAILASLFAGRTHLCSDSNPPRGSLPSTLQEKILALALEKTLRDQDPLSLMGVLLGRSLAAGLRNRETTGLIVGSSRGPTQSLEKAFHDFEVGQRLKSNVSPTTTASGLSAVMARDLGLEGPSLSLSAACSTGLYNVIESVASLKAGLCDDVFTGGMEAANTEFTFEMLRSARVLNTATGETFPCRPGAGDRRGMVLSEGAALLHLTRDQTHSTRAAIIGWGAATEGGTLTGVSENGDALVKAIQRALTIAGLDSREIDFIVGHGAGTLKGDAAELAAYNSVFGSNSCPPLVWHKWCGGHMLGASAALSVMLGVEHLTQQQLPPHPYLNSDAAMFAVKPLKSFKIALITSMGFGGSACALLVKKLS